MNKTILIIGMGQGLSFSVAERFGQEGYKIGMISRNEENLLEFQKKFKNKNIIAEYAVSDVSDTIQMIKAINQIKNKIGSISILHYNAVDYRMKNIMEESLEDLTTGFKISIGNAFVATIELLSDLKENKGAVLFTGGSTANIPNPDMASISLGKAGLRNLTYQFHHELKKDNIFVGTVTINGWIDQKSETHSPEKIAQIFWELNSNRDVIEVTY